MAYSAIKDQNATVTCIAPVGGATIDTPILIGQLFGVPAETVLVGESFELQTGGEWELPKQAALAITLGADVYFDSAVTECDTTNTNHHIGKCSLAAAGADTTVRVKLGLPVGTSEALGDFAALFGANSIVKSDAVAGTPESLTVGEQTLVGRITGGEIAALTPAQVRTLLDVPTTGATIEATDYDAQTVLVAVADNTPLPVTIADSQFVGRPAGGNLGAMSAAQALVVLNVESGADVTDEANVLTALSTSAAAKNMGGGALTNVGLVDGRDVSTDGTALDAAVLDVAELGAENTDGHMAIPFVRGLAEAGTWTPSMGGDGLPIVTRTAAAATEEFWIEVPAPARTTALRGVRPTGLAMKYSVGTADLDDVRCELWLRTLGADNAAPTAAVIFGDQDADYDAAHNTAAERGDDTGAPEHHLAVATDLAGSAYLAAGQELAVRVVVDGDAGAAGAFVLRALTLLYAETRVDLI